VSYPSDPAPFDLGFGLVQGLSVAAARRDRLRDPRRLLSSTPFQTSFGECRFKPMPRRYQTGQKIAEHNFRCLIEAAPDAMIIVNRDGDIVLVNSQTEKIFGYERNQLLGMKLEMLLPSRYHDKHREHRTQFFANFKVRLMGTALELYGQRKDGTEFPVEIMLSPVESEEGTLVVSAVRDITERKRVERELQTLSIQKNLLLQEMQHRVANTLQIIASILLLKAQSVKSEETRLHLREAHQRVLSVAAVQQHLHDAGQGGLVQVASYLAQLCDSLASSMIGDNRQITLSVEVERSEMNSTHAVSLGLIVTELVINALKHAFPGKRQVGQVVVSYEVNGLDWRLIVSDNGVGQPESPGPSVRKRAGLGTSLVQALAQQFDAQVEFSSGPTGTSVSVAHAKFRPSPLQG
jgi:PAS domain S-box-containing protein